MSLVSVCGAHTTPSYNARISNGLSLKIKEICQFDFVLKIFESKIENLMLKLIGNSKLYDMSFERSYVSKEEYFLNLSSPLFENIMFRIDEY